ncbi:SDR family oxidoreductase [Thermophagus sp. OGC60D27]|uniref:SDR family oxidoreductase n=1 Tax=Thermophagus sp. OGC60D27 TaxID=3458415 RepID=UPI004037B4D7
MKRKTVLITGASSGIGKETVSYFAHKGWKVAATMRDTSRAGQLKDLPGVAIYRLDVTQPHIVDETIQKAWDDLDGIAVVINNAGYGTLGTFEGANDDQIIRQIDTNFLGTLRVIKALLPLMRERREGTIINLSSMAGRMGLPLYSLYNASKYAIEGFTESLYFEVRPFNIKVRLIEPGPVCTEFYGRSKEDIMPPDHEKYIAISQKVAHFYNITFKYASAPKVVAKTIFKAAVSKRRKLRYKPGFQVHVYLFIYRLLPLSWFQKIIRVITNI